MSISKVQPVAAESGSFGCSAPMNFLFKVQSFSLLLESSLEKYESNEFEAGGNKWKLVVYPNGNSAEDGNGHISLYLVLADTSSLSTGWELNVLFRLFVFDHVQDKYVMPQEMKGTSCRFHEMKKVRGFAKFLSLPKFNDPSNGFLVDDTCAFGAEVFVIKPTAYAECLTMIKQKTTVKHTWRIENFSKIKEDYIESEKFIAGDHNWCVRLYPNCSSSGKNSSVSIFLNLAANNESNQYLKVCADYKLRLMEQTNSKHIERNDEDWFSLPSDSWGWEKFINFGVLFDKSKGFLVKDTIIVEASVEVLGVVSKLL